MVLYLTYWFRQREQAQAIALFLTAVPVTSIVGAPMSGLILVTSVANLGGFAGPYAVGLISRRTGSLYGGLALAGVSYILSATLALLLPRKARALAKG